jgi:hypothetical protein
MRCLFAWTLITWTFITASGCDRSSSTAPAASTRPAASYRCEIRTVSGVNAYSEGESISVTGGEHTASVQGGRLTVNGKAYGALKDRDSVVIDENGKVTVNGTERSPEQ